MKQFVLMLALTAIGSIGPFVIDPFLGVAVYYLFAVLRPQYVWQWALPVAVAWSWYVAVATLAAVTLYAIGVWRAPAAVETDAREGTRLRMSFGYWAVVLYGMWTCLSYVTAQDRYFAYPYLIEYLKMMVMFIASAFAIRSARQLWMLYLITAGVVGYVGYEMNAEYLLKGQMNIYVDGFGGYDNNGAGLVMAMGVPLCLFAWEGETRRRRWIYLACVPALLHAVLMSFSRGAMLSLIVGTPLFLFRSRHRSTMLGAILMLVLAVPVLAGREIRDRFTSVQDYEGDRSSQTRLETWTAGWQMALDYPILGVGIRNSDLLSYSYGADFVGRTIHNQYLQVAADSGFPALAFYLLAFIGTVWSTSRVRRRAARSRSPEARRAHAIASGIDCALMIFLFGAIFLYLGIVELTYLLLLLGSQLNVLTPAFSEEPALAAARLVNPFPVPVWPQGMYRARS